MSECCRAPLGEDMKLFESMKEVLSSLENRGTDKIIMDISVGSKRELYLRLVSLSQRIAPHLEK